MNCRFTKDRIFVIQYPLPLPGSIPKIVCGHALGETENAMYENITAFVARGTNSGKTYLIERLISAFKARGRKVAAVKHSTHLMEVDKKGKDTYKFCQQGADRIILFSDNALMLYELAEPGIEYLASLARNGMDIVLVEGFKSGPFGKIEVFNPDLYDTPLCLEEPDGSYIALVSKKYVDAGIPWFSFDDVAEICDFIESRNHQR